MFLVLKVCDLTIRGLQARLPRLVVIENSMVRHEVAQGARSGRA